MRLTIISDDMMVIVDGDALPIENSIIPNNVRAIQWYDTYGEIEFNDGSVNQQIAALPDWVAPCVAEWEAAKDLRNNPPEKNEAEKMKIARDTRDELLVKCDWVVIKCQEAGQGVPQVWIDYRQALRDITNQGGFPDDITWPTKPA